MFSITCCGWFRLQSTAHRSSGAHGEKEAEGNWIRRASPTGGGVLEQPHFKLVLRSPHPGWGLPANVRPQNQRFCSVAFQNLFCGQWGPRGAQWEPEKAPKSAKVVRWPSQNAHREGFERGFKKTSKKCRNWLSLEPSKSSSLFSESSIFTKSTYPQNDSQNEPKISPFGAHWATLGAPWRRGVALMTF